MIVTVVEVELVHVGFERRVEFFSVDVFHAAILQPRVGEDVFDALEADLSVFFKEFL